VGGAPTGIEVVHPGESHVLETAVDRKLRGGVCAHHQIGVLIARIREERRRVLVRTRKHILSWVQASRNQRPGRQGKGRKLAVEMAQANCH
jgi:hypothetical protein